jgi:predicted MFS family arabinose efflux permease
MEALLALAAAISVANLYYAQPLAATMATSLHVSDGAIGVALTLTQLGYALGMILLVPLGDGRERRSVIVATSFAAALSLLFVAGAPSYPLLLVACLLLGFASSLPQMVLPFAVGLVKPEARGKTIGTVMGGLLAGILLSRTASGAVASLIGWRLTFAGAAGLMLALTAVLRFALPVQHPPEPMAWGKILASLASVVRTQPILRRHALVGALGFAGFSVFWSTLSFQLATFGHGSRTAGAFGILGLSGIVVAPIVGRISGRIRATTINAVALATVAISFAVFGFGATSLLVIGVGVVLLDAGAQANHLANQTVIFGLAPELRNRLNAIYMVCYFLGGAAGTALASVAWSVARWTGVCVVGGLLALLGALPLLTSFRTSPSASPPAPRSPSRSR